MRQSFNVKIPLLKREFIKENNKALKARGFASSKNGSRVIGFAEDFDDLKGRFSFIKKCFDEGYYE